MESAPVPRPIASSAYSFVRFCGGAVAPFVAGKLAEHVGASAPFYLGGAMTAIGVGVLWFYRRSLVPVEPRPTIPAPVKGTGLNFGVASARPLLVAAAGPGAGLESRCVDPSTTPGAPAPGTATRCSAETVDWSRQRDQVRGRPSSLARLLARAVRV